MTLKHRTETLLITALMRLFGLLPLDVASHLGGFLGRNLGPLTGIHRKSRRQMLEILSDHSPAQIDIYLNRMWDNLGRTMAEYPHLPRIMRECLTLDNRANLTPDQIQNGPAIFIAGHFANWEVAGPSLMHFMNTKLDLLYRAANNRGVNQLLNRYRSMNGILTTIPKSRTGMRTIVESLKNGHKIGILIDQKYNEGTAVPFFGKMAMTSPAFVQLAQKFKCPVYPAQIVRENGARFKITLYPPLSLWADDGSPRAVADVVADAHHLLENWMREHPDQWLWVHQRWSSKAVQNMNQAEVESETMPE